VQERQGKSRCSVRFVRGSVGLLAAIVLLVSGARLAVAATGDVYAGGGQGKVKVFSPTGALIKTLDCGINSSYTTGMAFDSQGNLYATLFSSGMAKWPAGSLTGAAFGSGFNADPESVTIDSSDNIYVGQADGSHQILKFSTSGTALGSFSPAPESRGTDWIDLAADQCTMYYTSEGSSVKRYNVCTSTQLADFGTGLAGGGCYAVRVRTNGEVLVACTDRAYRLNTSGVVMQTYLGSSFTPAGTFLFALNLDPDGTTFWTGNLDQTGQVFRINIATGAQVTSFPTNVFSSMAGLAVEGEIRAAQEPREAIPMLGGTGLYVLILALMAAGVVVLLRRA
jgi:DNA-binding beta-propeller fold protein YncE